MRNRAHIGRAGEAKFQADKKIGPGSVINFSGPFGRQWNDLQGFQWTQSSDTDLCKNTGNSISNAAFFYSIIQIMKVVLSPVVPESGLQIRVAVSICDGIEIF